MGLKFRLILLGLLIVVASVPSVFANWVYTLEFTEGKQADVTLGCKEFDYGDFYISKIDNQVNQSGVVSASLTKTDDVKAKAEINLGLNNSASVSFDVRFYNASSVTYYYDQTKSLSYDNEDIAYTISGIKQKDAVAPNSHISLTITFTYDTTRVSDTTLDASLHFLFVVDKDSIGVVAARTVIERFGEILNNIVSSNSYDVLDNAMNSRSGWNKASDVTYIGNVVGSNSQDSKALLELFGSDVMSMDLDGDGKTEPITIMIKRENLDGSTNTGGSYTYTQYGRDTTVNGVEMTIYITSQDLDSLSTGKSVVVYAATYTKLSANEPWTLVIPMTKGTAPANNYSMGDYSSNANSFNTSKWKSDNGQTLFEIIKQ